MPAFRNLETSRSSGRIYNTVAIAHNEHGWDVSPPAETLLNIPSYTDMAFSPHSTATSPSADSVDSDFEDSVPRINKRKAKVNATHASDTSHIPRPKNAFILFRSSFYQQLGGSNQNQISVDAGKAWKALSAKQKEPFQALAEKEKHEHRMKHPHYTYAPSLKSGNAKRKNAASKKKQTQPSQKAALIARPTRRRDVRSSSYVKVDTTALNVPTAPPLPIAESFQPSNFAKNDPFTFPPDWTFCNAFVPTSEIPPLELSPEKLKMEKVQDEHICPLAKPASPARPPVFGVSNEPFCSNPSVAHTEGHLDSSPLPNADYDCSVPLEQLTPQFSQNCTNSPLSNLETWWTNDATLSGSLDISYGGYEMPAEFAGDLCYNPGIDGWHSDQTLFPPLIAAAAPIQRSYYDFCEMDQYVEYACKVDSEQIQHLTKDILECRFRTGIQPPHGVMTGTTESDSFIPTDEELGLVGQIYERAGCLRPGYISGETVVEIFTNSIDLSPTILSTIWDLADESKSGYLSETGLAVALRLVGWAQSGKEVSVDLVNKLADGPLPRINGVNVPSIEPQDYPLFTEEERDASLKLFEECSPVYGLLEGEKARDVFLTFDLSPKDLWKIWEISDTRKRGALDRYDFALAIYLIQGVQTGRLTSIPPTTPPQIYEQIRAMSAPASPRISSAPTSPQLLGSSVRPKRPTRPPPSPIVTTADPIAVQLARSPTYAANGQIWNVNSDAKVTAEEQFQLLDSSKAGYIGWDVATEFMLKFELSSEDVALIWDLADLDHNQRLNRDEFVVAMHLIEQRLNGVELPHILPPTLIPPSFRNRSPNTPLQRSATASPILSPKSRSQTRARNVTTSELSPPLPRKPSLLHRHSVAFPKEIHPPSPPAATVELLQPTVSFEEYEALERQNKRLSAKVDRLSTQITALQDPFTERGHVPLEKYRSVEEENLRLSANIKEITSQLDALRDLEAKNDALSLQISGLLAKIQETEQMTSDLLQSNEAVSLDKQELQTRNAELENRLLEVDSKLRPQLEDTTRRLDNAVQENRDLSERLRQNREAAEAESRRNVMEMEDMKKHMQALEEDNKDLRKRADDLQRTISKASSTSGSSTNAQEMEILMGDVTRENEDLKRRLRDMESSTANLLLSSNGHAEHDKLRLANQRLTSQIEDLEQLIAQLQSSSEEHELQRVLKDVTMENDQLKGSLREIGLEVTRLQQSARQIEPLQTELEQLKAEIRRLHAENLHIQTRREDASAPPPAYDDDPFH
ncbi:hypothetical protein H0H92_003840 [Tricholoma furcatifolium]|nr:hypothetical protein H0H92_003840 [Tricholoma furcatifolium]